MIFVEVMTYVASKPQFCGFCTFMCIVVLCCRAHSVTVDQNRAIFLAEPQLYAFASNETLRLDCSAVDDNGNPLRTRWIHNFRRDIVLNQLPNGSISFPAATGFQAQGSYRCVVLIHRPYVGILLSPAAEIKASSIRSLQNDIPEVSTKVGQVIRLSCLIDGYPSPNYSWYHNGMKISAQTSNGYTLASPHILYVTQVDMNSAGNYTCSAANNAGHRNNTFIVIVKERNATGQQLNLLFSTENFSAVVGKTAIFECLPEESSKINKTLWIGPGMIYSNGTTLPALLKIDQVQRKHEGLYQCQTLDQNTGRKHVLAETYLTVQYPPTIKEPPREQIKSRGEVVRFICNVQGYPQPRITWYKNGELLKSEGRMKTFPSTNLPPDRSFVREEHSETIAYVYKRDLLISSIRPEDGGIYQCFAANDVGEASAAALLIYSDDGERQGPFDLNAEVLQLKQKVRLKWELDKSLDGNRVTVFILHFHSQGDVENTEPISFNGACDGTRCSVTCCDSAFSLKPFTNYTFWVSALLDTGKFSIPSNEVFVTSWEHVSQSAANLIVRQMNYSQSVHLNWSPPPLNFLRGTVQEYCLEYVDLNRENSSIKQFYPPTVQHLVVTDLKANTEYKFRVIPKTRAGYPSIMDIELAHRFPWLTYKIKEINDNAFVPLMEPFNVDTNHSNALLTWVLNDTENKLNWPGPGDVWKMSLSKCGFGPLLQSHRVVFPTSQLMLQNLEPFTFYCVNVTLEKSMNERNTVQVAGILFQTLADQLLSNVMQRDSSLTIDDEIPYPIDLRCTVRRQSLLLQWTSNGKYPVSSFIVRYSRTVENFRDQLMNGSLVSTIRTNDSFAYINDLILDQLYLFAVRSETAHGPSKFSDDIVCFVPKSTPLCPRKLRYNVVNETDVLVYWEAPDEPDPNNPVVSYHVLYETVDPATNRRLGPWSEILVDGLALSAQLHNLSTKNDYRVTVTAANRAGISGSPSDALIVKASRRLAGQRRHNEALQQNKQIIVVERKSYAEGIIVGLCVAIIIILLALCIKIRKDEGRSCNHFLWPRGSNRLRGPCMKRNDGKTNAFEIGLCSRVLIPKNAVIARRLSGNSLGAEIEEMSPPELSFGGINRKPTDIIYEKDFVSPFLAIEIGPPTADESPIVTNFSSAIYSDSVVHSAANSESKSDWPADAPKSTVDLVAYKKSAIDNTGDRISIQRPSSSQHFFSMPNLLTDSGIGFDEYCYLSSGEFAALEDHIPILKSKNSTLDFDEQLAQSHLKLTSYRHGSSLRDVQKV